jgi:predicted ATPase/DNA-binding SARP family transcriptional activator
VVAISVLGPLDVSGPGVTGPITGRNERIVLAVLVALEGEVVSRERLTEALWGDEPPRSSAKVVQNLLLRLRKTLGAGTIETRPGGYLLHADSEAIDVRRFARLAEEGRAAAHSGDWEAAARAFGAAVALWRGPPLVELERWPPGRWEAARLEEEHRVVCEELAEAELACGHHRERLALLYKMVSEEPLRERRWALLMMALYRCGQQAEALRSFQRARASLAELGLAPGPELSALEQAISRREVPEAAPTARRLAPERSLSGNIPSQLTSFVGREDDLRGVAAALRESRLVTITGPGGVGKTRLAMRVAADISASLVGDGAWFCDLAAAATADDVSAVVAGAVGARYRSGRSVALSVVDRMRDRASLVLLDNCEHVLDDAGRLAKVLLEACPHLHVLATSRERLGVGGERVWPLAPLSVPDPSALGDGALTEGVMLFADRARAVKPSFTISPTNLASVNEICFHLDGMPLAIELAAARVAAMTPFEIATNLDDRFELLRSGGATADDRHRTLRATIDWSYSLLDDLEQTTFDRLGVFTGRFDAAAAAAVAAPEPVDPRSARSVLGELVGQSMVTVDDAGGEVSRYSLLDTFRHYALERLDGAGCVTDARRRHARHYARSAEQTGHGLRGPDELAWRSRFRADRDNLRAAVSWSLASEDAADRICGLRIIAALAHESMQEGEPIGVWSEVALEHADGAPPGVRAAVFASAAWFVHRRGDVTRARELCREALRHGLPEHCPSPELPYFVLALAAVPDSVHQAAIFDEAHAALDAICADDFSHGFLWSAALFMQVVAGDELCAPTSREAIRVARHVGNPSLLVRTLCNLAAFTWLDDPDAAREELEEAVSLAAVGASSHMLGFGSSVLARLHMQRGDLDLARDALRVAIIRSREDSDPFILATTLDRGIHVAAQLGQPIEAATWAGAVVDGPLSRATLLPARERPLRVDALAGLRATLGDEAYVSAAARGARMTDADLVRHALTVLARAEP